MSSFLRVSLTCHWVVGYEKLFSYFETVVFCIGFIYLFGHTLMFSSWYNWQNWCSGNSYIIFQFMEIVIFDLGN